MARLYKTNGDVVEMEPKNGSDFTLEELKCVTDGLIEVVYLKGDEIMIIDEEGKLNDSMYNKKATDIFRLNHPQSNDFIVGNALVCKSSELK